jgi:voltage-gated potassium channel
VGLLGGKTGAVLGSPVRNLVSTLVFVMLVGVGATLAYMRAGWSFGDASYMVVLTLYSVGYGEVRPIDTPYLHAVTMATMFLGCTGMILLTGVLVQVFTELQLRELFRVDSEQAQIDRLEDHVVVCGFGRIGVMLAKDLTAGGARFVILERTPAKLEEARGMGFLCLVGDATDESALLAAGITRARVLATVLPDDAANVFITLSARSLNPGLEIIARGEVPSTESKLVHAGANQVVLPTHIGAERIAELILHPMTADRIRVDAELRELDRGLREMGLNLVMVQAAERGGMTGLAIGEAERRGGGMFFVTQIERTGGELIVRPAASIRIEPRDTLTLITRGSRVTVGAMFAMAAETVRAGRTTLKI